MLKLCYWSNRSHGSLGSRDAVHIDLGSNLATGVLLRAVARNVAGFTALVASLASSVQRTTVGSSAVARNVTKLSTGVAFHSLSLAIPGKVVGTTTLVAGSRTRATSKSTTASEATGKSTTSHRSTTAHGANRVRACTLGIASQYKTSRFERKIRM